MQTTQGHWSTSTEAQTALSCITVSQEVHAASSVQQALVLTEAGLNNLENWGIQ